MYIVIELQKTGNQVANIVSTYTSVYEAESKYHQILAAAAISQIETHSAVMLDGFGGFIKSESYTHEEIEENEE